MSPKVVDKEMKREKILRAALKVFSEKGITAFKIIDVARVAGVGKGTIYEYFSSKDEMIVGCFNLFMHDLGGILAEGIAAPTDPKEKIESFFRLSLKYFADQKEALGVLFDFWAAGVPHKNGQPLIPGIDKGYIEFQKFVGGILEDGIAAGIFKPHDTATVALIILAMLDGLLFQSVMGIINIDDISLPDKLSKSLLEGILK